MEIGEKLLVSGRQEQTAERLQATGMEGHSPSAQELSRAWRLNKPLSGKASFVEQHWFRYC